MSKKRELESRNKTKGGAYINKPFSEVRFSKPIKGCSAYSTGNSFLHADTKKQREGVGNSHDAESDQEEWRIIDSSFHLL
jgi:hypothetical protein